MKIRTKLIIEFLLIVFMFVIVLFLGIYTFSEISSSYSELNEIYVPFTRAAIEISSYSKRSEGHLILYLILHNEIDREKFFSRVESLKNEISIVRPLATAPKDENTINTIDSATDEILKYGNELLLEYDKNPSSFNPKEHEDLIRKFHDTTSFVREKGVELSSIQSYSVSNKTRTVEENIKYIQDIVTIFVIFLVSLSLVIIFFLSRSITNPIKKLTKNIEDISMGRLDTKVDPELKESKDEIGNLARAFDRTLVSLKLAMRQKKPEKKNDQ
jgi:methyl-accepting chemotaxis protein